MENLNNLLNRANVQERMQSLREMNCVKDVKFPVSYSLQSVDLKPIDQEPGLVNLTLRQSGEIRVVHGNKDIYAAVTKACDEFKPPKEEKPAAEGEGGEKKEGEGEAPAAAPEPAEPVEKNGVWKISSAKPVFGNRDTALKLVCKLLENIICSGWEILAASEFTNTPGFELATWVLKKSTTPLTDAAVTAIVFSEASNTVEVVGPQNQPQVNNVVKQAAENVTPKAKEGEKKEEKKEEEEEKKDEEKADEPKEVETAEEGDDKPKVAKPSKDDPNCPTSVTFQMKDKSSAVLLSKLVLELSHLLFCRQWKLISTLPLASAGDQEVLFFCRDGRILPALGQESFAMVELQKPDVLRLYHVTEEVEKDVRAAVQDYWSAGMESKEAVETHGAKEYKLLENPWTRKVLENSAPNMEAQMLVSRIFLALNKKELNLYARICLDCHTDRQKTLLMFRQSNVTYSEALTIQLTGLNRLAVLGASDEDLEVIRNCLLSRWPYPLTHDSKMFSEEGNEEDQTKDKKEEKPKEEKEGEKKEGETKEEKKEEEKEIEKKEEQKDEEKKEEETEKGENKEEKKENENEDANKDSNEKKEIDQSKLLVQPWLFKVKRYPWAVSYGNKHLDTLVEAVRVVASRRNIKLPSPKNMDAESAKSLLSFLLKDLGEHGWRLQTSADICSSICTNFRPELPERQSDAHALFLLR